VAQVAINTVVAEWRGNRLRLAHLPEYEVMIKPETGQQIRQALQSALGVELTLEFVAQPTLDAETPYQAHLRHEAEARQQAISAIRQDPTVQQLRAVFGAELIENTVKKLND
jgi:hypothetical protein